MKHMKRIWIGIFSVFTILAAGIPLAGLLSAETLPVVVHIHNVNGTPTQKSLELRSGIDREFQLDVEVDEGYEITGINLKAYQPDPLANINGAYLIQVLNTGEQTYIIKSKRTSDEVVMPEVNVKVKVSGISFKYANYYYYVGSEYSRNFISLKNSSSYESYTYTVEDESILVVHADNGTPTVEGLKKGTTKVTASNAKGEKAETMISIVEGIMPDSDVFYHAYYDGFPVNHPTNQTNTIIGTVAPLDTFADILVEEDSANPETGVIEQLVGTDKIIIKKALTEGTYRFSIKPTYSGAMKGPATIQGEIIIGANSDELADRSWVEFSTEVPSSGWFQTLPTIRLTQKAKDLGYEKIIVNNESQADYVASSEGSQTITMKFEKADGTVSTSSVKITMLVDTEKPSIPVLTKEKDGTITMRATDPVGGSDLYAYHYELKDTLENKVLLSGKGTYFSGGAHNYLIPSSVTMEALATTQITVYATDNAGNASERVSATLDTFKSNVPKETPVDHWLTFDKEKNSDDWYQEKPTMSISSSASALGYTSISVDGGIDKTTHTITADGSKSVSIVFKKGDATESNALSVPIKLDTKAPVIKLVELVEDEGSKQIHIQSEDVTSGSGIKRLIYRIEDSKGGIITPETTVNTPPEEGIKIPSPVNMKFIVFVKAVDNAGNEGMEKEQSLSTVAADLIKDTPEADWLVMSETPVNGWYTKALVLSISSKANDLGYNKFGVTVMNPTLNITTEGESKLTLTFEKEDGVQSNTMEYTLKLDTKTPTIDDIVLEPTSSMVEATLYRMSFAKTGSDKQIRIHAEDGAIGSGITSIVTTIADQDLGVDLVKNDKVAQDTVLYQLADDKEVKVCSKAIDQAGHEGAEICKTISTKLGGVTKSETMKNQDTGIVLKAIEPVFEEHDTLQSVTLSDSDAAVKAFVSEQKSMLFEKGVELSWLRGVSKQSIQAGMKLEIPAAWIKNYHVFVEMKDGSFKNVKVSGTSAIADIDTFGRVILLKQVENTPTDEQTELKDKTSGIILKLSQGAFKANTTLRVSDVSKSIDAATLQGIQKECESTQEVDKIYKVEVFADNEAYTPDATMQVQIPAGTLSKAAFLIPDKSEYVAKEVIAKDGFFDIETTSLGNFTLLKNKVEAVKPTPEDTIPTDNEKIDDQVTTTVKGATTADSTNALLWTSAVIGTVLIVVFLVKRKQQDSIS